MAVVILFHYIFYRSTVQCVATSFLAMFNLNLLLAALF